MEKSLYKNISIYMIKTVVSIILPIITFPYISRTLGVEVYGEVQFVISLVTYFQLIAGLGINSYAIREGSKIRDNREELRKIISEVFVINVISTFLTYCLMMCFFMNYEKIQNDAGMFWIYGTCILFTTFSMEWVFNILEEYSYIAKRSILFQVISFMILFIVVREQKDYMNYIFVLVFPILGTAIANFKMICSKKLLFHSGKYELKKHIKPILYVFGINLASSIYLNLDTTMLGMLKDNYEVGIYSAAIRITKQIIILINAICSVFLPRITYYFSNKSWDDYYKTIKDALNLILMISIPISIGLLVIGEDIILIMCGSEYIAASEVIKILAIELFFAIVNGFLAWQILMPWGKEKMIFVFTLLGGITDFLVNLCLIPKMGATGAAVGTMLAEIVVFLLCIKESRNILKQVCFVKIVKEYFLVAMWIVAISLLVSCFDISIIPRVIIVILGSVFMYFLQLLLNRNTYITELAVRCKAYLFR